MLANYWQNLNTRECAGRSAQALRGGLQHLPAGSLEPAGYHAPELLLPIFAQNETAKLALVEDGSNFVMVAAFQPSRLWDHSVEHPLLASGTPLVSGVQAGPAVQAFLKSRKKPFLFQAIRSDGAFFKTLQHEAKHFQITKTWVRASLQISGSFDDWMARNFDQKRRKEFKRLRNRLSEQGDLQLETLSHAADVKRFAQNLLELEAAGWKGQRGTALNNDQSTADAFHAAMVGLFAAGKLRFWQLTLNDKAIAALFAIVEGDQAWLGKIAYDEAYAKFSPGVSIVFDATVSFFEEPGIVQVDSSAIPNHPMIDRIWRDRIAMVDVLAGADSLPRLQFNFALRVFLLKQNARAFAKDIFYKVTKRKKS